MASGTVFSLLLLLTTALGMVLAGHPAVQQRVLASALHQFPVIGDQLAQPYQLSGEAAAVVATRRASAGRRGERRVRRCVRVELPPIGLTPIG